MTDCDRWSDVSIHLSLLSISRREIKDKQLKLLKLQLVAMMMLEPGWDVADGGLDVVGDPLDEVAAVLVLDVQHLLVHLHAEEDSEDEKEKKMMRKSKSFFSHLLH